MNITERMSEIFGAKNVGILGIASGPCLLYLIRRYGYTTSGGDGYKQICYYVLRTKNDAVQVHIAITASWATFGVAMQDDTERNCLADEYAKYHGGDGDTVSLFGKTYTGDGNTLREVIEVVDTCLADLLRPVKVRDVAINVLGVVREYDADDIVAAYEFAGWGVESKTNLHDEAGTAINDDKNTNTTTLDGRCSACEAGRTEHTKIPQRKIACSPGEVGAQLKEMRQENRLTQIEVAGLINRYSTSVISHYERGKRSLTLNKLEELAGVLGYEVEIVMRKKTQTAVNGE